MSSDDQKNYEGILQTVNSKGSPSFRQAYAYGLGMILNLNQDYLEIMNPFDEDFKKPEYLHLVVSSEISKEDQ